MPQSGPRPERPLRLLWLPAVLPGAVWHVAPWKQLRALGQGLFLPSHGYLTPRPGFFATAWMNAGSPPSAPEIKSKDAPKWKEDTRLLQPLLRMLASRHYANTVHIPESVSQQPASKALAQAHFMPAVLPPPKSSTRHSAQQEVKCKTHNGFSVLSPNC